MKTTYPPNTANNEQDWENYAKSTLNHWYTHVYTLRDDPKLLDYAKKERQLFALQKRLATGTVKNYFALKNKIKNWVGLRFRSGEQVLVNETENQLIVNFVSMDLKGNTGISAVVLPWHIRLVIEIKANKVRVSAFDDMGSASTSISRSYYLSAYFKKDGTIKMPNTYKNGFLQFKVTIASLVRDLEKSILQPTTSDDW